ncbi:MULTISPECIES: hypothetical protein [Flammeovirga]|uniref:Uncharacterized protein n=1 Tax=Flammeovirga agarivorans TaxID=2726742 RepID=A0A7X8SNQ8_9BACT|nr:MULTISPECIES: hypothetical protein [Flammeovirga]NLR93600.1 hypothetical protein [Flammeovirga agarivorans]
MAVIMKDFKDYFLNFIIGVFPFLALAYHLFFVHKAYRMEGLWVAIVSFFTPVISDIFWFITTLTHYGYHVYHTLGILGIGFGVLWYFWGKKNQHLTT